MMSEADQNPPDRRPHHRVEPARGRDLPQLVELLSSVVPDCAPQTVWELPWSWPEYFVIRVPRAGVVAAGSLHRLSATKAELRGIVVSPSWRGKGLAAALVCALLNEARRRSLRPICVTSKMAFFRRFGFRESFAEECFAWHRMRPSLHRSHRTSMALLAPPKGGTPYEFV